MENSKGMSSSGNSMTYVVSFENGSKTNHNFKSNIKTIIMLVHKKFCGLVKRKTYERNIFCKTAQKKKSSLFLIILVFAILDCHGNQKDCTHI